MIDLFAKNLKYLREKRKMEQLELAEMLGKKSSSSISEWEKGKYTPRISVLNEIAKIFNVVIDDLMNKDLSSSTDKLATGFFVDTMLYGSEIQKEFLAKLENASKYLIDDDWSYLLRTVELAIQERKNKKDEN